MLIDNFLLVNNRLPGDTRVRFLALAGGVDCRTFVLFAFVLFVDAHLLFLQLLCFIIVWQTIFWRITLDAYLPATKL